jgi:hypothetical protein
MRSKARFGGCLTSRTSARRSPRYIRRLGHWGASSTASSMVVGYTILVIRILHKAMDEERHL